MVIFFDEIRRYRFPLEIAFFQVFGKAKGEKEIFTLFFLHSEDARWYDKPNIPGSGRVG